MPGGLNLDSHIAGRGGSLSCEPSRFLEFVQEEFSHHCGWGFAVTSEYGGPAEVGHSLRCRDLGLGSGGTARLRHRRCGIGRVRDRQPAERGSRDARAPPRGGLDAPDLELIFAPVLCVEEGLVPPPSHGLSIAAVGLQPRSRGCVRLRSADPLEAPEIDPAFLQDSADGEVLVEGLKLARRIAGARPL